MGGSGRICALIARPPRELEVVVSTPNGRMPRAILMLSACLDLSPDSFGTVWGASLGIRAQGDTGPR